MKTPTVFSKCLVLLCIVNTSNVKHTGYQHLNCQHTNYFKQMKLGPGQRPCWNSFNEMFDLLEVDERLLQVRVNLLFNRYYSLCVRM